MLTSILVNLYFVVVGSVALGVQHRNRDNLLMGNYLPSWRTISVQNKIARVTRTPLVFTFRNSIQRNSSSLSSSSKQHERGKIITIRLAADGTPLQQCQCVRFYLCNSADVYRPPDGKRLVDCGGDKVCCKMPYVYRTDDIFNVENTNTSTNTSASARDPSPPCTCMMPEECSTTLSAISLLRDKGPCNITQICCPISQPSDEATHSNPSASPLLPPFPSKETNPEPQQPSNVGQQAFPPSNQSPPPLSICNTTEVPLFFHQSPFPHLPTFPNDPYFSEPPASTEGQHSTSPALTPKISPNEFSNWNQTPRYPLFWPAFPLPPDDSRFFGDQQPLIIPQWRPNNFGFEPYFPILENYYFDLYRKKKHDNSTSLTSSSKKRNHFHRRRN